MSTQCSGCGVMDPETPVGGKHACGCVVMECFQMGCRNCRHSWHTVMPGEWRSCPSCLSEDMTRCP